MRDYRPPSRFLRGLLRQGTERSTLDESSLIARLIKLTSDKNVANRDWAIFLLRQQGVRSEQVRDAFRNAAQDEDSAVRGEAILGLAGIDRDLAIKHIKRELSGESVTGPVFEAATLVADRSLLPYLQPYAAETENEYLNRVVSEALAACGGAWS